MLLAAPAAAQTPAPQTPEAPAPELPVRVWSTSDGKHIRFDLPEVVPHRAWIDGDRLIVSFARPVRADLVTVMKGLPDLIGWAEAGADGRSFSFRRSEEHTSELQSLMRISYAVFCLKKKKNTKQQ